MKTRVTVFSFLIVCVCLVLSPAAGFASTNYTYAAEGFEQTGIWPTSNSSKVVLDTSTTGAWTVCGASRNTSTSASGSACLATNSSGYFITPYLPSGAGTLTINTSSSSSSGRTFTVSTSADGTTYTQVYSGATGTSAPTWPTTTIVINNSSVRYIKIANGGGGQSYFDNVLVTSALPSAITVSSTSLTNFGTIVYGSSSASASYTVSGVSLTENLVVTAPAHFQVSTNDVTFSSSLSFTPSTTDSTVAATAIYVRCIPTSATGAVSGTITHTSGYATAKSVAVSALALAAEPTTQSAVTFGTLGGTSIVVNFSGGDGAYRILVVRPNSAVSWTPTDTVTPKGVNASYTTATDQGDGNKIVYQGSGNTVTVAGLTVATTYYFAVYEYNGSAANSQNYLAASPGTGSAATLAVAGLTVSSSNIAFGQVLENTTSTEQSYTLSGSYLTPESDVITVTAPTGFEISTTSGSGFASSITVPYSAYTLAATPIYVRFEPTAKTTYAGLIANSGGGAATLNVAVSGVGADAADMTVTTYYVAPDGNDATGTGTISSPWFSVQKAINLVKAGDVIYMRGGSYTYTATVTIKSYGTAEKNILLSSYTGERALLDFSSMAVADSNYGMHIFGSYWHIYGIDIKGAGDNGMLIERNKKAGGKYADIKDSTAQAHNNLIEYCSFYENRDAGMQLKNLAAYNKVINCDSYFNRDPGDGNADGFAPKLTVGEGNYFYGCRSWNNSDDGWDGYLKATEDNFPDSMTTTIENCWCIANGFVKDGSAGSGNGNGFKMGGSSGKDERHNFILRRCLSVDNLQKGFDQNNNMGNMTLINCSGYSTPYTGNSSHYTFRVDGTSLPATSKLVHTNCLTLCDGLTAKKSKWAPCEMLGGVSTTNNYLYTDSTAFISLDTSQLRAPRQSDGSLPVITFMHIKPAVTALIDQGTIVDSISYYGATPDLGAFETNYSTTDVAAAEQSVPKVFGLSQNYPNPFNPSTVVSFTVSRQGKAVLKVYDALGREVAELFNGEANPGRQYSRVFGASKIASGVYFSVLSSGSEHAVKKMILMK
jgi:hypothetical protein